MTTKLQKKIFINMALIMILFLVGLISIFSADSYKKMTESRKNNLLVLSAKTTNAFLSLIQDMDSIALHITSNAAIRDSFSRAQKEPLSHSAIYDAIKDDFVFLLVPVDASRFRISIYNAEGNFISTGIPYSKLMVKEYLGSASYQEYYENISLSNSKQLFGFAVDPWSASGVRYLSLYRELSAYTNSKKRVALIDIQCSFNTVDAILSLTQSDTSVLMLNNNNELVYHSLTDKEMNPNLLVNTYLDQLDTLHEKTYQDRDNLVTTTKLSNGWNLLFVQSLHSPSNFMGNYIFLTIVIALFCLSSALFIVYFVIKYNTKPLQYLTTSVQELSLTSPYLDIDTSKYSDEIVNLTDAFNQMVNKLTASIEENARAREYEMRANLVALQSQMDPHFLYNMLAVISAYDKEEDFDKIQHICIYMSSMLRYISSYLDNTATLDMELEHTRYYLQLMKYRFEDQFQFEIRVDAAWNLETVQIPRLILQPILENCFQHGFKKILPPWCIYLAIYQQGNNGWIIEIKDNGCGFSMEQQKELNKRILSFADCPLRSIESLKIGGMGLVNTLVRLQLYLKNSFYYEIDSPPEGGTCIRIGVKSNDEYHTD